MTGSERPPIIIAGAGIGGLTAALTLAAVGFRVVIAERTEELSEVGAGIYPIAIVATSHQDIKMALHSSDAHIYIDQTSEDLRAKGFEICFKLTARALARAAKSAQHVCSTHTW